jgi:pyruvate dehydrogenase (quinone)
MTGVKSPTGGINMRDIQRIGFLRRGFLQGTAITGLAALTSAQTLAAAPSETDEAIAAQPAPAPSNELNTSDILIETLIDWGATHVFGIVGDGINSIIEALRKRQDRIQYVGVRHEEAAAFMAAGFAKHTGRLGVCVGTTGPGAIHLINGLYEAALDGAPVVALTGLTFHDLRGARFQQGVDTVKLMQSVALYNEEVTGPEHAIIIGNRACRVALADRGVAHLTISKDVQMMKLAADKRSMRNPGVRTSSSWSPPPRLIAREQMGGSSPAGLVTAHSHGRDLYPPIGELNPATDLQGLNTRP